MNTETSFTLAIADNHELMRNAIINIVNSFGYKVIIEAENGRELIDQLRDGQMPDICILDINMPFMDGFQAAKYLKEKWPAISIMILSMNDDIRSREKAIGCGADAFLTKYTSIEILKETLENLNLK